MCGLIASARASFGRAFLVSLGLVISVMFAFALTAFHAALGKSYFSIVTRGAAIVQLVRSPTEKSQAQC